VHLLGISGCWADSCAHANVTHYRPDVLQNYRVQSGGGASTPPALVTQQPCSCGQAAVPRSTEDPARGNAGALPWV